MSFMPDTNVYIWLFPLGILSVWLINMGVRKLIAKRKTIIESMVNNARAETQSLELWLCKSGFVNHAPKTYVNPALKNLFYCLNYSRYSLVRNFRQINIHLIL